MKNKSNYLLPNFFRSQYEIGQYRSENQITVRGSNVLNPVLEFSDAGFPPQLMSLFREQGFERPTSIQAQSWPFALSGRDLVGIAQTGSGKTLSVSIISFNTFTAF